MSLALTHILIYLTLGIRQLVNNDLFESTKIPAIGGILIWLVLLIRFLMDTFAGWSTVETALYPPTAISLLLFFMTFAALNKGQWPNFPSQRYKRSELDENIAREMAEELINLMTSTRNYLEPEFSLSALSESSGQTRHQISQALNIGLNQKLTDMIFPH